MCVCNLKYAYFMCIVYRFFPTISYINCFYAFSFLIYWLCWVLLLHEGFSSCAKWVLHAKQTSLQWLSQQGAGSQAHRFSGCCVIVFQSAGSVVVAHELNLLRGMWNLLRPGSNLVSLHWQSDFLTTGLPGVPFKNENNCSFYLLQYCFK